MTSIKANITAIILALAFIGCSKVEPSKAQDVLPLATVAMPKPVNTSPMPMTKGEGKPQLSALEYLAQSSPPPPIEITPEQRAKLKERDEKDAKALQQIDKQQMEEAEAIASSEIVSKIRSMVLADTIRPSTAVFGNFSVGTNSKGNRVYQGWYSSVDLAGKKRGHDKIVAEVDRQGNIISLTIGDE